MPPASPRRACWRLTRRALCAASCDRAVWCLWPAGTVLKPYDVGAPPRLLSAQVEALLKLGFAPLGGHLELPRFHGGTPCWDFAHRDGFATLYEEKGQGRLYFLTPFGDGGSVVTANYRRPAREVPGKYLSGGMEGWPVVRVWKAHQRRLDGLAVKVTPTLDGRLQAGRE